MVHHYINKIYDIVDNDICNVDVIGICTKRGKIRERTNRNGETFIKRDIVLADKSARVVVRLTGHNSENFGNCQGFPVVGVGPCHRRHLGENADDNEYPAGVQESLEFKITKDGVSLCYFGFHF